MESENKSIKVGSTIQFESGDKYKITHINGDGSVNLKILNGNFWMPQNYSSVTLKNFKIIK